jgi:hypothetical protein
VIRVVALATRRGPADEARTLYLEIVPDAPTSAAAQHLSCEAD